jgi:Tfp pilus assembly protein PilO
MALPLNRNYKMEYGRYRHYFHRLWIFYQRPSARVSTALILTLFTIIFFAAFAIRPTLITVAELLRKISDQQQVLESLKNKSAALASAQQEYVAAQDSIAKLNLAVPQQEDLPDLIKQVESVASAHQVPMDSATFGEVVFKSTPPPGGQQTRDLTIVLTTDYATLTQYLQDLIRLPRLVSVKSLSFSTPSSNSQTPTAQSLLQLTVNLVSYYLPRQDNVSPGGGL